MKLEDQLNALAELDGFYLCDGTSDEWYRNEGQATYFCNTRDLKYLASYDAIIPLIQKQTYTVQARMIRHLEPNIDWDDYGVSDRIAIEEISNIAWKSTPSHLSEVLLKALYKWKE